MTIFILLAELLLIGFGAICALCWILYLFLAGTEEFDAIGKDHVEWPSTSSRSARPPHGASR
jgi:hypothetical protein